MNPTTRLFAALLSLGSVLSLRAATLEGTPLDDPNAAPPKIASPAAEFNFGSVPNSQVVDHTFEIRNEGGQLLRISQVQPTCGCTVAEISSRELAPGESATIRTKLDLRGRSGNQYKSIAVHSNDPGAPKFDLVLRGDAVPNIRVEPASVHFGNLEKGVDATRSVILSTSLEEGFTIQRIDTANQLVKVEQVTVEEGRKYELRLSVTGGEKPGRYSDVITARTSDPTTGTVRIMAVWQIQPPISYSPSRMVLSPSSDGAPLARHMVVRGNQENETKLEVLGVEWAGRTVEAKIFNTQKFGWRVSLYGIVPSPDMDGEEIVILTNIEGFERLVIPVDYTGPK